MKIPSDTPLATADGRFGFIIGLAFGVLGAMMLMFPVKARG